MLGRRPRPGQQHVLDVALEHVDDDWRSPLAYDVVDVIVGRRFGKTLMELGVPLWRMHQGNIEAAPGRALPFRGAHTAQNLTAARRRFLADLVEPIRQFYSPAQWKAAGFHEVLAASQTSLSLDIDHTGPGPRSGRHEHAHKTLVIPPTKDGFRGEGFAHVSFDEVLTFTSREGEALMNGARATMKDYPGHAQMWRVSNVATFSTANMWLQQIRDEGRAAVAADRGTGIAYFEWSIPEEADPADERHWWDYYPPLADGSVRIEDLRTDLQVMSLSAFAAEYLGRWPDTSEAESWLAIRQDVWEGAGTTDPMPDDVPAAIGVHIDPYGRSSTIVAAAMRPDSDTAVLEVLDHRAGSKWLAQAVRELAPGVVSIGITDYGPGHDLADTLADDHDLAEKLVRVSGQDLYAACYLLDADLREHRLQWRASDYHQPLVKAAQTAQRTSGSRWAWEERVATSQSPVMAATLALWALGRPPTLAPDSEIF